MSWQPIVVGVDASPEAAGAAGFACRPLGGQQHAAWGRWLGGSTSLTVERTTDVPVLVAAGSPATIRRVLVAVDQSRAARPTLRTAERCARLFGAELRALSVLEPLPVT